MYKDVFDPDEGHISPRDHARLMFEHTDVDGILYIPDFSDMSILSRDPDSLRCVMEWSEEDLDSVLSEFGEFETLIGKIAEGSGSALMSESEARSSLDGQTFDFWDTYMRPLELPGFDGDVIDDISDRIESLIEVRRISSEIAAGKEIPDFEMEYYLSVIGDKVSDAEMELYDRYWDAVYRECEERIGSGCCQYQEIIRVRRLERLCELGAPKIVLELEGRSLIQAMILNRFCVSMQQVDNNTRLLANRMRMLDDEEMDEYFRPKSMNSRKSLAPLFVYLIIKNRTDAEDHMRQQDILRELAGFPYEIVIERKALSRIIHNLADSQVGIHSETRGGVWYEMPDEV